MTSQDTPTRTPTEGKIDLPIPVVGPVSDILGIGSFAGTFGAAMQQYVRNQGLSPLPPVFSGLSARIAGVRYLTQTRTAEQPEDLVEVEYVNDTSVPQQTIWTRSATTAVEASISVTEGLEAGANANFEIPAIGLGMGVDVRASLSTTTTQTRRVEQSWEWSVPILVPPFTIVRAQARLNRVRFDLGFQATVRIDGSVSSCTIVGMRLPTVRTFRNSPGGWVRAVGGLPGYTADGTAALYTVSGTMRDVQGAGISIVTRATSTLAQAGGEAPAVHVMDDADALPRVEEVELPAGHA